ncbi:MAG: hypothetical protein FJ030_12535 [Chloroflexi bacterium]|nr:hypothetical protein [Chloroflexota bacterium]
MRSKAGAMVGLILLYWLTRLIALDSLAFFIDEANHLWWARDVWALHPFHAASDGRLLNVLWMAAFWPFNAAVWLSRASVALVTTAGFACALAFAHRLISFRAAAIAGLLYIFLPLTFFFERMALADSLSAPFVAGALWAISQWRKQPTAKTDLLWAALGGIALTAAAFSKISNLIFLCIPIFAAVFLFQLSEGRRAAWLAGATLAAFAVTALPSAAIVKVIGRSDLGLDLLTLKASTPLEQLPRQIITASGVLWNAVLAYFPFPMWLIVLIGIGIGLWRGGRPVWFVFAVLAATVGALVSRTSTAFLETRFLPAYAPLVVIVAAAGLTRLTEQWKPLWLALGAAAMISSGLWFEWIGWTRAEALPLPRADEWQYITGWPSGYGFREIAAEAIARGEPATLVTLDLGGEERFAGYLLGKTDVVTAVRYREGMSLSGVLLVIDTPKDDSDLAEKGWALTELARYPRPGGESALVVYRVEP